MFFTHTCHTANKLLIWLFGAVCRSSVMLFFCASAAFLNVKHFIYPLSQFFFNNPHIKRHLDSQYKHIFPTFLSTYLSAQSPTVGWFLLSYLDVFLRKEQEITFVNSSLLHQSSEWFMRQWNRLRVLMRKCMWWVTWCDAPRQGVSTGIEKALISACSVSSEEWLGSTSPEDCLLWKTHQHMSVQTAPFISSLRIK